MNNSNALPSLIRIDQYWLATEPLDMRAGPDTALARVINVFGQAKPHHAYLFANKRGNRMKVLVHDGLGVWLYAIEQEIKGLKPDERHRIRQLKAKPITDLLLKWLQTHREKVPKGGVSEKPSTTASNAGTH